VASRIERVTLQLDRAQVVRRTEVSLGQGAQQLVFPDLPMTVERASLRLGTTASGVVVGRPTLHEIETLEPLNPTARRLREELRRLQRQRRIESDTVAVQELLLEVLRGSVTIATTPDNGPTDDVASLLGVIETRAKEAVQVIRRAEQEIERLDAEIDQHERQLARLTEAAMQRLELSVPVTADAAGSVVFELTYSVRGVGFTPLVEADLDVTAATVTLTALAEVSQQSGEDWENVELVLSTVTPSWRTAAPELETWYIDVERDRPAPRLAADAATVLAEAADVVVDDAAFDVVYRLDGAQTVPSDGGLHQLRVGRVETAADLVWRTAPALDEAAFLTAAFTYEGPAPLLAAPVFLSRDGQPVGEHALDALMPGTPVELGFGLDPAIDIERRLVTDERARSGLIGSSRRHERRYVIEATNRRDEPITLEILEQLPISRDTRITVELLPATAPPSTTEHDGAVGVLAWTRDLPAGETQRLTFGYVVRHPADIDVMGF
jgi:hypothetical protein